MKYSLKNKAILLYFSLLFVLLFFIYLPSFFHPPRSDYWTAFYLFYRLDMLLGLSKWKYILTYDPIIKITFRPLCFLIPYFEHIFFGTNFIYTQITTFGFYFISTLLLYKLAKKFCKSRLLTTTFIGVFACLFSHFDLVCWSFQSHIILSPALFILGFILYINYLKSNRKIMLFFVVIIFLSAMLFYESLILWPLAIIILSYIKGFTPLESPIPLEKSFLTGFTERESQKNRIKLPQSYLWVIVPVYGFYILCFFLNRTFIKAYQESQVPLSPLFSIDPLFSTIFLVFFNVLYNNLLVNLMPQIAFPLKTEDRNLEMTGLIASGVFEIDKIIFIGGSIAIFIFSYVIVYLFRKKQFETIKGLMFFIFLLFSELFTSFYFKFLVNSNLYSLAQFRYQYIPNIFFMLIILFLIDRLLKPTLRNKVIVCLILSLVAISNIYATKKGISILNQQLAPLQRLITNIKIGIKTGQINAENRLYLDDKIAKKLPHLCWNSEMGRRCMRGTYQWLFSKEIKCFSTWKDAKWVVNEGDLGIISK